MRTEHLVSQIVLAASWDFSEDPLDPVDAAADLMGVPTGDPRLAQVRRQLAAAGELSWEEQVGVAAHALLAPCDEVPLAA